MPVIGGKLTNFQDPKGTIANADQIEVTSGKSVLESLNESNQRLVTLEEGSEAIMNFARNRKFDSLEEANAALTNGFLTLGDPVTVCIGGTEGYLQDYKLYVVAEAAETKNLVLKEISGGAATVAGKVTIDIEEIVVQEIINGTISETIVDPNESGLTEISTGSKIIFRYKFFSSNYPDVRGRVVFKRGTTELGRMLIYPRGEETNEFIYDTTDVPAGTYNITVTGIDSSNVRSETHSYKFAIGGLSVDAPTFNDSVAFKKGEDVSIPLEITAADTTSNINIYTNIDDKPIDDLTQEVRPGEFMLTIPSDLLKTGVQTITVFLQNENGKTSNYKTFNIVVAEEGKIYILTDQDSYSAPEGSRFDIITRVISLNSDSDILYPARLSILDSSNKEVLKKEYSLKYGINLITLINIPASDNDYNALFSLLDIDTGAVLATKEFKIKITENSYNIAYTGQNDLIFNFSAEGHSNTDKTRDIWEDSSSTAPKVNATLHNFNWETNGWCKDDNTSGDTSLTLNSGAYAEIDYCPFSKEINNGEAITISIDFSTKDILDPEAKVVSCLYEYPGTDDVYFYLRDILGDYVKKDDNTPADSLAEDGYPANNIIRFFMNSGGYCWVNGITYGTEDNPINMNVTYESAASASDRALNYNLGDENPKYNINANAGALDYRLKSGSTTKDVTKQIGFYITTQYAVLTNSASPADILEKFYLNFSEDTRTRIDFIITRDSSSSNPYHFTSMIGYCNGILSLMKEITTSNKFHQSEPNGSKFKIYLGGKGTYDTNGNLVISDTGSAKVYNFRMYKRALAPKEILTNYAASLTDMDYKKQIIDNNALLEADTVASKLPYMVLTGYKYENVPEGEAANTILSFIMQLKGADSSEVDDLKKVKKPAYIKYIDPNNDDKNWYYLRDGQRVEKIPIRLQFQGTSSMVYPVKNYKFKMYESFEEESDGSITYNGKVKQDLGNGIRESTFCLKADFMDSSHCNNTGSAMFISDYNEVSGKTPASELKEQYRTTIFGYPILLYYQLSDESTNQEETKLNFIGVYNLNLDKSCTGSFGFEEELKDSDDNLYKFSSIRFIDDDLTRDIMDRIEIEFDDSLELAGEMEILLSDPVSGEHVIENCPYYNKDGKPYAVKDILKNKYYLLTLVGDNTYVALKDSLTYPESGIAALLTREGFIRTVDGKSRSSTQCFEFKANSGANGAGGFGSYEISSIAKDLENRYPDDGDLEEEDYAEYVASVGSQNAIGFDAFRSPFYYNIRRNIKWLRNSNKDDFRNNFYKYYDTTYALDYYLTIMLLGGVDSLGKNLMVASWGPENHLYETTADYNGIKFEYTDPYDGSIKVLTPEKVASFTETYIDEDTNTEKIRTIYKYGYNSKGQHLYYKESVYNRFTKKFLISNSSWDQSIVTTVPGEGIQRPIFYDIDTINGLDNAGQLIFDSDIEIGDTLSDGTAVFNTDNSHLWGRIKDFMPAEVKQRWQELSNELKYFTLENLVDNYYYGKQISKIPETYYNQDCFLKYIWEGPKDQKGSGAYLYCIHGSRYEHIKRWYKERINYINTLFGIMGKTNSSLRFNHAFADQKYIVDKNWYNSYEQLAEKYPDSYYYNPTNKKLYSCNNGIVGLEIKPIVFNFRTYQPGYVGVKWSNNDPTILYYRVHRNETIEAIGNVPTSGDAEVFIYGGENIKEIGDLSAYNVKSLQFSELTKLNKLILGSPSTTTVIKEIILGNNEYLSEINVENCPSLVDLNVSGCINLKKLSMTGSGVTSVTLPASGGALEFISYPSSITLIQLSNFINLNDVRVSTLNNLQTFVVMNCPKILGSKESPNARVWDLLQLTERASALSTIKVESYGSVNPTASGFFFPNKYCNFGADARNIKGEIYYTGTQIPTNYTKFESAFPNLKITYDNIVDASEMFADYKNLNCIGSINAYKGNDNYGNPIYGKAYYWTNTRAEEFSGIKISEKYESDSQFYSVTEGGTTKLYRLIDVYDDSDLDTLRAEIKKNVSIFSKFTNVTGMFRNLKVLDYLDPDTFNNIDLSSANTTEMFDGCINLKYFETPNDVVKNKLTIDYYNSDGEKISKDEYDKLEESKRYSDEYYVNPFTETRTNELTSIYKKGIRNIGPRMFNGCKRAKIYIRNLSNSDKIIISDSAFQYTTYDPSKESQARDITLERPVILFERERKEILLTTTESSTTVNNKLIKYPLVEGETDLYYKLNNLEQKQINFDNKYYSFSSNRWLREVYFGVTNVVLYDNSLVNDAVISYAECSDGKRILFKIETNILNEFNISNQLNLKSLSVGAIPLNKLSVNKIGIIVPEFDCLDTTLPLLDIEKMIYPILTDDTNNNIFILDPISLAGKLKTFNLEIYDSVIIPERFAYCMNSLSEVKISKTTTTILESAFEKCTSLNKFDFGVEYISDSPVTYIGNAVFKDCNLFAKNEEFRLPELSFLGEEVFSGCSSLGTIVFPSNLKEIPAYSFYKCSSLQNIYNIPDDIERIGNYAFYNCEKLEVITTDQYSRKKVFLSSFTKLKYIGDFAFYLVTKFTENNSEWNIHPTLKYIGNSSFAQNNDTSNVFINLIWQCSDYDTDFKDLSIGSQAFANMRFCWDPDKSNDILYDTVFVPKVARIGENAFKPNSNNTPFKLCLMRNSENEIGSKWVKFCDKIIFNYYEVINTTLDNLNARFILASETRKNIFTEEEYDGVAYLHAITTGGANGVTITPYISYDNKKFCFIEILSNSFDKIKASGNPAGSGLNGILFEQFSQLELIETSVLKADDLTSVNMKNSNGELVLSQIPSTLTIETGNKLKDTSWFKNINVEPGSFITLGRYIIGYKMRDEDKNANKFTLDLTVDELANTDTIFDNAFSYMNISDINFPNNKDNYYIYQDAFSNCKKITEINLPKNIRTIGENAFNGCKLKSLYLPATLTYIGNQAFLSAGNNELGTLTSVYIEDGANIEGEVFAVPKELNTGLSSPSSVNVTLKELHVPTSMPSVLSTSFSYFQSLSQITKLYLGKLETNDDPDDAYYGTIYCKNYPLYKHIETENDIEKVYIIYNTDSRYSEDTDERYTIDEKPVFVPKFYHDIMASFGYGTDTNVTTFESHSVNPLGDTDYDEETKTYKSPGFFCQTLNLANVKDFRNNDVENNIDLSKVPISNITEEDYLRILAGITCISEDDRDNMKLILPASAARANPIAEAVFLTLRKPKVAITRLAV